jgi:hypothetical protein
LIVQIIVTLLIVQIIVTLLIVQITDAWFLLNAAHELCGYHRCIVSGMFEFNCPGRDISWYSSDSLSKGCDSTLNYDTTVHFHIYVNTQ